MIRVTKYRYGIKFWLEKIRTVFLNEEDFFQLFLGVGDEVLGFYKYDCCDMQSGDEFCIFSSDPNLFEK